MKDMIVGCIGGRRRTANITNMVVNGNFAVDSGWTSTGAEQTISANMMTFRANSTQDYLAQTQTFISGHKYFACASVSVGSVGVRLLINDGVNVSTVEHSGSGNYELLSVFLSAANNSASGLIYFMDFKSSGWTNILIKYVTMIDLTAAFGAGNEPSKADMDAYMATQSNLWLNGTQAMTLYY